MFPSFCCTAQHVYTPKLATQHRTANRVILRVPEVIFHVEIIMLHYFVGCLVMFQYVASSMRLFLHDYACRVFGDANKLVWQAYKIKLESPASILCWNLKVQLLCSELVTTTEIKTSKCENALLPGAS